MYKDHVDNAIHKAMYKYVYVFTVHVVYMPYCMLHVHVDMHSGHLNKPLTIHVHMYVYSHSIVSTMTFKL